MYITIDSEDIWKIYSGEIAAKGLYRGGGNTQSSKMYKNENGQETVRPADFKIVFDKNENEDMVYPDPTKGLSFSSSLQRLEEIPIRGKVWLLPRDKALPNGLVINYKTIDHPLVNVKEKMSVKKLIEKLKELEQMMQCTGVTIR